MNRQQRRKSERLAHKQRWIDHMQKFNADPNSHGMVEMYHVTAKDMMTLMMNEPKMAMNEPYPMLIETIGKWIRQCAEGFRAGKLPPLCLTCDKDFYAHRPEMFVVAVPFSKNVEAAIVSAVCATCADDPRAKRQDFGSTAQGLAFSILHSHPEGAMRGNEII